MPPVRHEDDTQGGEVPRAPGRAIPVSGATRVPERRVWGVDRVRLVDVRKEGRRVNRFYLSSSMFASALWTSSTAVLDQRSLERGESAVRQLLRWPNQAVQEYWPYLLGGVVVVLLLRSYLRR